MSVLLPEDSKGTGPIQLSTKHGFPFVPDASAQAVAIINALVRLLDAKLVDSTNGEAENLTVQHLLSMVDIESPLITAENVVTQDLSSSAHADLNLVDAVKVTTAELEAGLSKLTNVEVDNLTVKNVVPRLTVSLGTITNADGDTLKYNSGEISYVKSNITESTNATITNATIDKLVVKNLTADSINYTNTLLGFGVTPLSYQYTTSDHTLKTFTGTAKGTNAFSFFAKAIEGYLFIDIVTVDALAAENTSHITVKVRQAYNKLAKTNPSDPDHLANGGLIYETYEIVKVDNWPTEPAITEPALGIYTEPIMLTLTVPGDFELVKIRRNDTVRDTRISTIDITSGFINGTNQLIHFDAGDTIYTKSITVTPQLEARG